MAEGGRVEQAKVMGRDLKGGEWRDVGPGIIMESLDGQDAGSRTRQDPQCKSLCQWTISS